MDKLHCQYEVQLKYETSTKEIDDAVKPFFSFPPFVYHSIDYMEHL